MGVRAVDDRGLEGSATVAVTVLTPCSAGCASGTLCLGGVCPPGAASPCGLGASCTASTDCGSGVYTTTTDGAACTSPCDAGPWRRRR